MAKKYTRKEFLQSGSIAALALLLGNCNDTPSDEKKAKVQPSPISTADSIGSSETNQSRFACEILEKENPRYEKYRQGFNRRINLWPLAIALPTNTEEVAEAVRYAHHHQLKISVRSGGHSMEGFSSNNDGLLIHLGKMNAVEFVNESTIRVEPGCTLSKLNDVLLPQGRLLPAGSCGSVAIGGLTTGGGYGLFSRQFGLTCDHLMEATMVDGNGKICSTKNDSDLLWALRGGGSGNFGIVTQMIFETKEAPKTMISHHFKAKKLDASRARAILSTWFASTSTLPHACFSAFVLNGSTLNVLITNFEKDNLEVNNCIQQLKEVCDTYSAGNRLPLAQKLKNYYGSEKPVFFRNSSAGFYKDFQHISACIEEVFKEIIQQPGMIFQVNTLGGKIKDSVFQSQSCFAHRDYNYISEIQAYWEQSKMEEPLHRLTQRCLQLLNQEGIKAQYINYCSLEFKDWQSAYYGDQYEKLREIKRKYDHQNYIQHPQSIEV